MIAQGVDLESIPRFLLFLFPLVVFFPVLVFLLFFTTKAVKTRQATFARLAILFGLAVSSLSCQVIASVSPNQVTAILAFVTGQLADIGALVTLVMILSAFEENKTFSWKVTAFGMLGALLAGAILQDPRVTAVPVSTVLGPAFSITLERGTFATLVYLAFTTLALAWVLHSFVTKLRRTRHPAQRRLVWLLFTGIVLAFAVGSLAPVALESREVGPLRDLIATIGIWKVAGMVIVGVAFARANAHPWLLQLQANHVLMVQSTAGIPMFSRAFREDISELDLQLLAGAISAVSSLFRESTKETSPLESLSFNGKVVQLVNREGFTIALMTDYVSQATRAALDAFVSEFETTFAAAIERFTGNVNAFDGAAVIAARYFAA